MEKKKFLYLKVSRDKYELPEAVADSVSELARLCGVNAQSVFCRISHANQNGTWCCYRRIEIEEE